RLGFRIAETTVEFDDLGCAVLVDHQTGIQKAGVDVAFSGHTAHGRVDDFVHHALVHRGGDHRGGGLGAHAAGVRTAVAIAHALVVLASGQRPYVLAVDHNDETGFFAVEEFLDHHARASLTEGIAREHVTHRVFGFLQGHGDDHPLARRQTVGFDDDRCAFFAQVGQRRFDF